MKAAAPARYIDTLLLQHLTKSVPSAVLLPPPKVISSVW